MVERVDRIQRICQYGALSEKKAEEVDASSVGSSGNSPAVGIQLRRPDRPVLNLSSQLSGATNLLIVELIGT